MDNIPEWNPFFTLGDDFVMNLNYQNAVAMSEPVEALDLIPKQLDGDDQGTSYIFSGVVTELRRSWCDASTVYLIHLTIEDDITDVEVVFPSSYLRRIISSVVSPSEIDNADYVTLLNLIGDKSYEVMVTIGPWNNVGNYFDLFLVKLFLPLDN